MKSIGHLVHWRAEHNGHSVPLSVVVEAKMSSLFRWSWKFQGTGENEWARLESPWGTSPWVHCAGQGNRTRERHWMHAQHLRGHDPRLWASILSSGLLNRPQSIVWSDVLMEIGADQGKEELLQFYKTFRKNQIKIDGTYRRSISSRMMLARVFPCSCKRYLSTHSTKWSLNDPLMIWWRRSDASNSWMLVQGKSFVNGCKWVSSKHNRISTIDVSRVWQSHHTLPTEYRSRTPQWVHPREILSEGYWPRQGPWNV